MFFFFNRNSLDFFNDVYVWKHCDWHMFETSKVTLKEMIEHEKELIKLNGPERYYKLTYGH